MRRPLPRGNRCARLHRPKKPLENAGQEASAKLYLGVFSAEAVLV